MNFLVEAILVYVYLNKTKEVHVFGKDSESSIGELVGYIFSTLPEDYYSNENRKTMMDALEEVEMNASRDLHFVGLKDETGEVVLQFAGIYTNTNHSLEQQIDDHLKWFSYGVSTWRFKNEVSPVLASAGLNLS